jgi:hypothetical protein
MRDFGYDIDVLEFEELPAPYRNAIAVYYRDEPWGELFGIGKLPTRALIDEVMRDEELDDWPSWREYHAWYLSLGHVPFHQQRWAVILSKDNYETLEDGWHRFHSYVRDNRRVVAAV